MPNITHLITIHIHIHIQVYASALQLVNAVLAEESVKASVNQLLVASSHKVGDAWIY